LNVKSQHDIKFNFDISMKDTLICFSDLEKNISKPSSAKSVLIVSVFSYNKLTVQSQIQKVSTNTYR